MRLITRLISLSLAGMLVVSLSAAAQSGTFSDEQLGQFVEAQNEVMEIRDDYVARIEATDDREAAMALEQEGNQLMIEAVEDTGLTVEAYSEIAQAASEDMELSKRIRSMMN